jgi:HEAT repeat protein
MNPIFAPGNPLAEPMERIVQRIGDDQRTAIVLVVADDNTLRAEACAELAERLSGQVQIEEFDYTHAEPLSLPRYCCALFDSRPVCVFATGLDALAQENRQRYEEAIDLLNMHRESLLTAQIPVVLWLSTAVHNDLLRYAPDFVDWRSLDVTFQLPDGQRVEQTPLAGLTLANAEKYREQERRLMEMLARPNLAIEFVAQFNNDLVRVRRLLGKKEASRQAEAAEASALASVHDYSRLESLYCEQVIERYGKLTLYSVTSDAPIAVDLERVFVKLTTIQRQHRAINDYLPTDDDEDLGEIPHHGSRRYMGNKIVLAAPTESFSIATGAGQSEALKHFVSGFDTEITVTHTLVEALRAHTQCVITGAPGAGKTTLLKYLALTFARQQVAERLGLEERRLPMLVALRDFQRFLDQHPAHEETPAGLAQRLSAFLDEHLRALAPHLKLPIDFFLSVLEKGRGMVLLDGLDEVADAGKRARVVNAVVAFAQSNPNNRLILTSRPRGYESEARQKLSDHCAEYSIRDFDDGDMAEFALRWYEAVLRDRLGDTETAIAEAKRQSDDLLDAIRGDARIRSLAHNPLLLSSLAMVHQRNVRLPQHRAELYDECTDLLLGFWEQIRSIEATHAKSRDTDLKRSEMRTLLEPVALWLHERGEKGTEVGREELEAQIARQFRDLYDAAEERACAQATRFLQTITDRTGLMAERETGVFAFTHLTFQEYLAARAIADREDYIDYTLQHLHDPWWREVILLEVGHLSDLRHFGRRSRRLTSDLIRAIYAAHSPLEEILKQDLLLAARCLCDVGTLGVEEGLRETIWTELFAVWRMTPYWSQQEEIAKVFAYAMPTGDRPRIQIELLQDLNGMLDQRLLNTLEAMGTAAATPEVLQRLLDLTADADAPVRWEAVEALGRFSAAAATPKVLQSLLALTADNNAGVRQRAAKALGRLGAIAATPEVLQRLLALIADIDDYVRWEAIEALWRFSAAAATPEVLQRLLDLTTVEDALVRRGAAEALGNLGAIAATPEVVQRLLDLTADADNYVRWLAARALGRLGAIAATPEVLQHLLDLTTVEDALVRRGAAEALGNLGAIAATPEVVQRLLDLTADEHALVRRMAAEALGGLGAVTPPPELLQRLVELTADESAGVQQAAAAVLEQLGSEEQILRQLTVYWRNQLADTNSRDIAYVELQKIAAKQSAASRNGEIAIRPIVNLIAAS